MGVSEHGIARIPIGPEEYTEITVELGGILTFGITEGQIEKLPYRAWGLYEGLRAEGLRFRAVGIISLPPGLTMHCLRSLHMGLMILLAFGKQNGFKGRFKELSSYGSCTYSKQCV